MDTIAGWHVDRVIADASEVHELAVSRDGRQAIMHIVAKGASSTLLYNVANDRKLVARGTEDGRAFIVTTDAPPAPRRRSRVAIALVAALVLAAAIAALAFVILRRTPAAKACADCVLAVGDVVITKQSFRMYMGDPYLFEGRRGEDRKRAALDLLLARASLTAEAARRNISVSEQTVADAANRGELAIGLRMFDMKPKLAEEGAALSAAAIDRYAKAVGFPSTREFFDEMRIEHAAIAARDATPLYDRCKAIARAPTLAVAQLEEPYRPCETLR